MATIIELEGYRVETAREPYGPSQARNLPERQLVFVRKSDGAFVEFGHDDSGLSFQLLWERAHGVPEDEMREWVQPLISAFDEDDWQRPAVAVVG